MTSKTVPKPTPTTRWGVPILMYGGGDVGVKAIEGGVGDIGGVLDEIIAGLDELDRVCCREVLLVLMGWNTLKILMIPS